LIASLISCSRSDVAFAIPDHWACGAGAEGEGTETHQVAQNIFLQSETAKGHHLNDDKSPLIGLMNCIICRQTMKIEKSSPDAEGKDIIQYRCGRCDRIERVRLFRRSRDVPV